MYIDQNMILNVLAKSNKDIRRLSRNMTARGSSERFFLGTFKAYEFKITSLRLWVPVRCKACKLNDPLSYPLDNERTLVRQYH